MSDMMTQRDLVRRLEQTQVTERPGGVTGFDTFYDTSTYVPTYLGLSTAGVTTYTTQIGAWTRIGNMVSVWGRVTWTAATGTGVAIISLPVAAIFSRVTRWPVAVYSANVTFTNGSLTAAMDSGVSTTTFVMNSPATNAAGTLVNVEAAGDVAFWCSYQVA